MEQSSKGHAFSPGSPPWLTRNWRIVVPIALLTLFSLASHYWLGPQQGPGPSPGHPAGSFATSNSAGFEPGTVTPQLDGGLVMRLSDGEGTAVHVVGAGCDLSIPEIQKLLDQEHGWRTGQSRFYYNGTWQSVTDLYYALEVERGVMPQEEMVCVLVAVEGEMPCLQRHCLLSLYLRPFYSDFSVLRQLLEKGEFWFLRRAEPRYILDAGANVGYSTVIFALQFPDAQVVAVELDSRNYAVLQRNTAHLRNVVAVRAGLYNTIDTLMVVNGTQATRKGWQYMLRSAEEAEALEREAAVQALDQKRASSTAGAEGAASSPAAAPAAAPTVWKDAGTIPIRTVTVDFLKQLFNIPRLEMVKIDIEGSEREVFTAAEGYNPHEWISEVKLLAVETHDRMKNGSSKAVREALKKHPRLRFAKAGEYFVWGENRRSGDGELLGDDRRDNQEST